MVFSEKKYGRILVIGDVMLDQYILGRIDRISPEAPVPVLREKNLYAVPGGAANVAANLVALGASVKLIGMCGEDSEGQKLRTLLDQLVFEENNLSQLAKAQGAGKVDTSGLIAWKGRPTTVKTRLVSGNQQIARLDREETGEFPVFICQQIIQKAQEALEWAEVVVFSDYNKGCLEGGIFQKIAEFTQKSGKPLLVDPKQADLSFYRGASLLTPNKSELSKATSFSLETEIEIEKALALAAESSGAEILLTRSEEGMSLRKQEGDVLHFPAEKVEVADVSGAGDTVLATIAVMLARGLALEEAVKVAIDAAALAVSRHGTVQITLQSLRQKIKSYLEFGKVIEPFAPIFEQAVEAGRFCKEIREKKKRIIFTNGCFDILHLGHLRLLQKASSLGDYLIVGLNTDASVKRLKGAQRPLQNQEVRAASLAALRWVDMVVLFDENTPAALLKELAPNVIVKGGDYRPEEVVGGEDAEVFLFPLEEGYSTTSFYQKLLRDNQGQKGEL
ncbi:bifunctional heptose 7-phosphate kinase/heptose 1-phosphate adenyltransferase [Acetobacteraceae bacterium]|nr:bifunctional heptose 7-phosphate kinase/heptose 1-phosphate adenyltransferase [Acetobacteraceae bacterium]